jgi:parallel beta-helix repeat protein
MSSLRTTLTTAALYFFLTTSSLMVAVTVPETVSAYTAHDPIYIVGDADFTSENGVTGGSGTSSDPYIIEGWEIESTMTHCIQVSGTYCPFVIRDCFIHGELEVDDPYYSGVCNIYLNRCDGAAVENVIATHNDIGLRIMGGLNITVSNSSLSSNWYGVLAEDITELLISDSVVSDCRSNGIRIGQADGFSVLNCTMRFNGGNGLSIYQSSAGSLTDNILDSSGQEGMLLLDAGTQIAMYRNTMISDSIHLLNCDVDCWTGILMDESNTVNGLPVLYYNGVSGVTIDGAEAGEVIIAGCENVTVTGANMDGADIGILVGYTEKCVITDSTFANIDMSAVLLDTCAYVDISNCSAFSNGTAIRAMDCFELEIGKNSFFDTETAISLISCIQGEITSNTVSNNYFGITLSNCSSILVTYNTVARSGARGIGSYDTHGCTIYHNDLLGSCTLARDVESDNQWDDGYPSGGNYWSDYTGVDEYSGPNQDQPGPDGIGDTPYNIDADSTDYYPLMEPLFNTPPVANFTVSPSSGYLNTVFSVDASSSSDLEHDVAVLQVRWDWQSDGNWDTFWTAVKTDTHQYTAEGSHTITLEVRNTDWITDKTTREIMVVPDDVPPVADAGLNQTVDEDTPVTFDGSDSSDNIGVVNYTWMFVDGTERTLYGVGPTYTFEEPGEYTVTLDVADDTDNHDTDTVAITVLDVNDPPVADAGLDQTVTVGEEVTFNGSDSSDDVGIENYTWTFTYGSEARTLFGVDPTFTFDIAGTYVVTLTVEDAGGENDTDAVTVIVEEEDQEEDGFDFQSYGLLLGIVVALAVIALIMFLVLRGRKGGKAPASLKESPPTEPVG